MICQDRLGAMITNVLYGMLYTDSFIAKRILIVGKGNKQENIVAEEIVTIDIDDKVKPDIVASVFHLPFKNKEFDLVICRNLLCYFNNQEQEQALKEMLRVGKSLFVQEMRGCLWKNLGLVALNGK
jgi:SAM-dependent methyltransferase